MRVFNSGATRDTDNGKLDYEGSLSPLFLEMFAGYMLRHTVQANGKPRESDNWQKHFGPKHYDVCMKSMWRHFMDLWKEHRGLKSREGIVYAMCGIMFNLMAYADKYLKDSDG